jgi:DNA (cytosine-5)-methyltransferase 1
LTLGFHTAGFDTVGAVELDEVAARSHARNFFGHLPEYLRGAHARARDLTETEPSALLAELGYTGDPELAVDVIVGGPPCQAFARVGRAKLREVADHPEAFLKDARSNLYLRYLHYVRELRPLAILMENVPDVLNYGGHNIAEEVCEALSDLGYTCTYTLLNSVFYGVPQMRERMFLMGLAREVEVPVSFPKPTHWIELPRGYEGTRQVALQTVRGGLFERDPFYVPPPVPDRELCAPAVTARDAIGDLPKITLHLEGLLKRGARWFDTLVPYPQNGAMSDYARLMRTWPGYESAEGVWDHVIRSLPRDYAIFKEMKAGDQYPEAHEVALRIFERRLALRKRQSGKKIRPGSAEYSRLRKATVPPYDAGKFPNKWRKMEADLPARTLMAHLGKDSYSHIHYDSKQARTISVREAARLQSFPDGFMVEGPMNPGFRQIGNAVPPLMAKAIAERILQLLGRARVPETRSEALDCV